MKIDYLFLSDFDEFACITKRKQLFITSFKKLDIAKLFIVVNEIESWYFAGLKLEKYKEWNIKLFRNTSSVTKEIFEALLPKSFDSVTDFMQEILKNFSIDQACGRNKSFKYFLDKTGLDKIAMTKSE